MTSMSRHSYYTSDILRILARKQADVFEEFSLNSHNDVSHLHCLMESEGKRLSVYIPICPRRSLDSDMTECSCCKNDSIELTCCQGFVFPIKQHFITEQKMGLSLTSTHKNLGTQAGYSLHK